MIVRTMISFTWVVLIYLNNSSVEFTIPYCYFPTILWCRWGPGSRLRGIVFGDGVWWQAPDSFTITQIWFLLVNHLILWIISTMVRLMTWKQGCIYGQGWMWFQLSMEHSLRYSNLIYSSFSLLLGLPSSGIMWCGVLLLSWFWLVFGPNLGFIKYPETQVDGLTEVLDLYDKH